MRTTLILLLTACTGTNTVPPTDDIVETPTPTTPACPQVQDFERTGRVPSPPAIELSGLAVDTSGRIWTHNDGGPAEVHVLDRTAALLGSFTLEGVDIVDLEDMAIGPGPDGRPWMYVGDIGDNQAVRNSVSVYRFPIPEANQGTVVPERLVYSYADGPRDAETLFVEPDSGALWIGSKSFDGETGFYRVDRPTPGVDILQRAATLTFGSGLLSGPTLLTAGDLSEQGLVLRTYGQEAFVWPLAPGQSVLERINEPPCTIDLAPEGQPEAIAWSALGLFTVSEGEEPWLHLHPTL